MFNTKTRTWHLFYFLTLFPSDRKITEKTSKAIKRKGEFHSQLLIYYRVLRGNLGTMKLIYWKISYFHPNRRSLFPLCGDNKLLERSLFPSLSPLSIPNGPKLSTSRHISDGSMLCKSFERRNTVSSFRFWWRRKWYFSSRCRQSKRAALLCLARSIGLYWNVFSFRSEAFHFIKETIGSGEDHRT